MDRIKRAAIPCALPQKLKPQEIFETLKVATAGDVVFLDIDDTLVRIEGRFFQLYLGQNVSDGTLFIDECKKNAATIDNFEFKMGSWRLKRRLKLVHPNWSKVMNQLMQRGVQVYGLTQIQTGSCGPISSMKAWRYGELCSLSLFFTPTFCGKESVSMTPQGGCFYKGIFMTGGSQKDEVVEIFLNQHHGKIFFVDDRKENLEQVEQICQKHSRPYQGLWIEQEVTLSDAFASDEEKKRFFDLQKQSFLEGDWLNDDEVLPLLNLPSNPF